MQIEKPHPDAVEKRELRSAHSKTFAMPDGSTRIEVRPSPVCYVSDTGELRSIDTTVQQANGNVFAEWLPYKIELHKAGIGFDFQSRESGFARVSLTSIGGKKFDATAEYTPSITGDTITFRDVQPGCNIVFRLLPSRVKTLRVLHNAKAPREFGWLCEHDTDGKSKIDSTLTGTDAVGSRLELLSSVAPVDGTAFRVTELWSGKAIVRDRKTRIKSLSQNVVYPVEIDPTVTNDITATANDVTDRTGNVYDSYLYLGNYGANLKPGLRFTSVNVPQGATVSSATLSLNVTGKAYGSYSGGTVYGYSTNNAAAWNSSGPSPSGVSVTTATATLTTPTGTGIKSVTVTSIVQEIVNRAGWVSGNAMSLVLKNLGAVSGDCTFFEDYVAAGTTPASLSITYTGGGGGGGGTVAKNRVMINQSVRRASTF